MKKIIAIIAIASLFSACVKNNPDPSWLEITAWDLQVNVNSQYPTGELTESFTNAWVYINDQPIGVFELPVKLPLLEEGETKVTLFPAVVNNGIAATKKIYPFVESFLTTVTLTKNATTVVNPTTRYISYTRFWIEDFEEASIKITDDANSVAMIGTSGDPSIIQPFNNTRFGRISLNASENKWVGFTDDVVLPKSAEVYLEIDYHNTNTLLTGVLAIGPTIGVVENPNIQLNAQTPSEVKWKKIYIDLKEILTNSQSAEYFKMSFQSILDEGSTTGEVNIDNVKLVYFQMNARLLTIVLILTDWLTAILSWGMFYYVRKVKLEMTTFKVNESFYYGLLFIPFIWMLLYLLQGTYHDIKRLHRIKIFNLTFVSTLIGVMVLFFVFLLDDEINGYRQYYSALFLLFCLQFIITFIPRLIIVSMIVRRVHDRKAGFKTLIIGGSEKAVDIYNEIEGLPKGIGTNFVGFININGVDRLLEEKLTYLGHIDDVENILRQNEIEEVIIALESVEHDRLKKIISRLEGGDVKIKILPDMYDILSGTVRMNNIFGALLIEVNAEVMPIWQRTLKRFLDILFSTIAILLLIPVYIILAILVKFSSPGPIFFVQERIGKNGIPFKIIKFRTMYINAEKEGPQLSSSSDPRITKIGRFMRKSRLDEFPQFFNVLIGDMSLVGPRPERQFFIDKIVEVEPQFLELTKVRPGITSWGQVKYGYAENVDQMLARMKYDLLYLKNRTLSLDFKIMLYTVLIVFKGAGKQLLGFFFNHR